MKQSEEPILNEGSLFKNWLKLERYSKRPFKDALAEINAETGRKYQHGWPSQVAARGYSMDRLPVEVRRALMRRVLPILIRQNTKRGKIVDLDAVILNLT